jgi:hypothetical protein
VERQRAVRCDYKHVVGAMPWEGGSSTVVGTRSTFFDQRFITNPLQFSRECQVQDWKNGIPRPHKLLCGKRSDNIDMHNASTVPQRELTLEEKIARKCIPDPDLKFKRSPELLHQISFLRQPPYVDYTVRFVGYLHLTHLMIGLLQLIFPYPHEDRGFTIPELG